MSAEEQGGRGQSAPISEEETFGLAPWVLEELDDDDALALLEALESIEAEDKQAVVAKFVPKHDLVQKRATASDHYRSGAANLIASEKSEVVRPTNPFEKGRIRATDKKLEELLSTSLTRASMSFQNQTRRSR